MKLSPETRRNLTLAAGVLAVGGSTAWAVTHPEEVRRTIESGAESITRLFGNEPPFCIDDCPGCGMG